MAVRKETTVTYGHGKSHVFGLEFEVSIYSLGITKKYWEHGIFWEDILDINICSGNIMDEVLEWHEVHSHGQRTR